MSAPAAPHRQDASLREGVRVGLLAAAATAGTLLGFGIRLGTPVRPFNAVARLVLGARAEGVWGLDLLVTSVGLLLHVTVMCAWGFAFVTLARGRTGWRRWGAAAVVALLALAVDLLLVERLLHAGVSGVLVPAQVVAVHLVLAVALGFGMRFATSSVQRDGTREEHRPKVGHPAAPYGGAREHLSDGASDAAASDEQT